MSKNGDRFLPKWRRELKTVTVFGSFYCFGQKTVIVKLAPFCGRLPIILFLLFTIVEDASSVKNRQQCYPTVGKNGHPQVGNAKDAEQHNQRFYT